MGVHETVTGYNFWPGFIHKKQHWLTFKCKKSQRTYLLTFWLQRTPSLQTGSAWALQLDQKHLTLIMTHWHQRSMLLEEKNPLLADIPCQTPSQPSEQPLWSSKTSFPPARSTFSSQTQLQAVTEANGFTSSGLRGLHKVIVVWLKRSIFMGEISGNILSWRMSVLFSNNGAYNNIQTSRISTQATCVLIQKQKTIR